MELELCFSLISSKFNLLEFASLIADFTENQWKQIYSDSMLLWPLYDKHNWSEEEYTKWFNEIDFPDTKLFPYEIRDQEEIINLLYIIPKDHRIVFYDDLLLLKDEFIQPSSLFNLNNYETYGIDRNELLTFRLDEFFNKDRTIQELQNYTMIQISYLENPNLYHKIFESNDIAEIKSHLKEYNWL